MVLKRAGGSDCAGECNGSTVRPNESCRGDIDNEAT